MVVGGLTRASLASSAMPLLATWGSGDADLAGAADGTGTDTGRELPGLTRASLAPGAMLLHDGPTDQGVFLSMLIVNQKGSLASGTMPYRLRRAPKDAAGSCSSYTRLICCVEWGLGQSGA